MTPIKGSISIQFAGEALHLLPDRAIWWPARSTLVIADAHFGKAASFRTIGVPVPAGATAKDLARLTLLLEQTKAQRLVILGDFLHSRAGRQKEVFDSIATWRQSRVSLPILLIRGNHDRSAGRVPVEWDIQEVEEPFTEDGISLVHDPACESPHSKIGGHVHPVVSLRDYDGSGVTLPCFSVDPDCLILPAFGTFTGGHRMNEQPGRKIFALANSRLVPLPSR